MSIPIYRVDSVYIAINKSNPPQLQISASGEVSSGGWKAPALVPRIYVTPPADGIQDLDFVATPPSGIAVQVILPVAGDVTITLVPWILGVRVHAKTNSVIALFSDEASHRELALAKLD
jgi:hypothetical protein